jgi:hypothetical protein
MARSNMTDLLVGLRMFASSFAPLFLLMALRVNAPSIRWALVLFGAVGILGAISILANTSRLAPGPFRVASVADRGPDVAGYLATYLLPFVTASNPSTRDLLAYAGFIVIAAVIYVQSEMLAINPLLYVFGYRVVAITTDTNHPMFLITRAVPNPGDAVIAARLADRVLLASR